MQEKKYLNWTDQSQFIMLKLKRSLENINLFQKNELPLKRNYPLILS